MSEFLCISCPHCLLMEGLLKIISPFLRLTCSPLFSLVPHPNISSLFHRVGSVICLRIPDDKDNSYACTCYLRYSYMKQVYKFMTIFQFISSKISSIVENVTLRSYSDCFSHIFDEKSYIYHLAAPVYLTHQLNFATEYLNIFSLACQILVWILRLKSEVKLSVQISQMYVFIFSMLLMNFLSDIYQVSTMKPFDAVCFIVLAQRRRI